MKTVSLSFNLYFFLVGAIVLALLLLRAEHSVVSIGLGVAAFFLFLAAFRAYRVRRSKTLDGVGRVG